MAKAKTNRGSAGTNRESVGYKELKAEIREGKCRDVYVLTGEEPFLIEKLVDSLTELLIAPGSLALDRVVFQGWGQPGRLDPAKLQAEVMTPPFLSRRKLVLVRQSGWLAAGVASRGGGATGSSAATGGAGSADDPTAPDNPDGEEPAPEDADQLTAAQQASTQRGRQEFLTRLLEQMPDSVCLVMLEQKVDRRLKALVAAIEKRGVLADIGREQSRTLQLWVDAECRRRGLSIAPAANESLIDRCESSMQVIWQEMNKIFLYCAYAGIKAIDLDLVAELSLPDLRGSIFDLTDALSAGQTGRALQLADTLISQKQPVQLIQFMLARHLRQLICAAETGRPDQIAASLKVLPFVASRLANQARNLPVDLLEDLYARCFEMDMAVKTGRISDRLALETLLVAAAEQMKRSIRR